MLFTCCSSESHRRVPGSGHCVGPTWALRPRMGGGHATPGGRRRRSDRPERLARENRPYSLDLDCTHVSPWFGSFSSEPHQACPSQALEGRGGPSTADPLERVGGRAGRDVWLVRPRCLRLPAAPAARCWSSAAAPSASSATTKDFQAAEGGARIEPGSVGGRENRLTPDRDRAHMTSCGWLPARGAGSGATTIAAGSKVVKPPLICLRNVSEPGLIGAVATSYQLGPSASMGFLRDCSAAPNRWLPPRGRSALCGARRARGSARLQGIALIEAGMARRSCVRKASRPSN